MTSGYKYVSQTFEKHDSSHLSPQWKRLIKFRKMGTFTTMEGPTNIPRARNLGYKAKQGYIIVLAKIRKGHMHRVRPNQGRKNAGLAVNKITTKKNLQWIAEQRAARKYPNLEVLNSYKVGSDGKKHYYEVIFVDTNHPVIKADPKINWICERNHRRRVYRGKTSAGRKARGLRNKGHGAEKIRPSLAANKNRR